MRLVLKKILCFDSMVGNFIAVMMVKTVHCGGGLHCNTMKR